MKAHPVISRLYDAVMLPADRLGFATQRAQLLAPARGRTLEIGFGTGLNLPHYPPIDNLVAVEPDPVMRRRAAERIADGTHDFPIELVDAPAESLPFDDGSFDTAVACLVLCSVTDPLRAIREVRRVLADDGGFLLLEHVLSENRAIAWAQHAGTPAWRNLAAGCHLDRPTGDLLIAGGFAIDEISRPAKQTRAFIRVRAHPA